MINELIKLADELDAQGFKRQANKIDRVIKKAAWGDGYEPSYFGMNQEEFRDLIVSVYETHFDETGEGWDPHEDDIEDIYSHLTVVPHPSDDDYEPEEDGQYWEYHGDGEYTFKGEVDFDSMDKDALKNYEIAMKIKDIMPHWDGGEKDSRMEMSEDDKESWLKSIDTLKSVDTKDPMKGYTDRRDYPSEEDWNSYFQSIEEEEEEEELESYPDHPDYPFPFDNWPGAR